MPARAAQIQRALKKLGLDIEVHKPTSGSHWMLQTEVSDVYLKAMCRAFGVDFDHLRRDL